MVYDLQKASLLKRLSAYILDVILLLVLITGVAFALSAVLDFNGCNQAVLDSYAKYETQFGIQLDISREQYQAMTQSEREVYDAAFAALNADQEALAAYNMLVNLVLVIVTFSILLAYLGLELLVPLLFGNGQTVGKKVFGIGLMKTNGVKVNGVTLFIRTVLGKFAIETMIPVLMILLMLMGAIGLLGPVIVIGIWLVQLVMLITSRTNSLIHDSLAHTVTVDLQSQMIFDSEAAMVEYKLEHHEEMVRRQPYR